ncbi:MAG: hypothetical protein KGI51_09935 [Rhodospirillales bacterium]|nr:hypothetical protein [Rhodospirillales bacterium]
MRRLPPPRLAPLWLATALLAGCAFGTPQSATDRDTVAACRRQAEATYRIRHRDDLYRRGNDDAPASGAVGLQLPTAGLADRFEQENAIQTCVHDTGTGTALHP